MTHNELISISDYFTRANARKAVLTGRPAHYAYHPCNDAVLSLQDTFGAAGERQERIHILDEHVFSMGSTNQACCFIRPQERCLCFGSQLSVE